MADAYSHLGHPDPDVLHVGDGYVVISKPSGMLSVAGIGDDKQDCVVARVKRMFPGACGSMVSHRLDMETSGLIVVPLTPLAQRDLSMQFEAREVEKSYVALLDGEVADDAGVVDLPMRLDLEEKPYQLVDFVQGKPARTSWRVLAREIDRTRVEFRPITGRTHQLRVHAAAPARLPMADLARVGTPWREATAEAGQRAADARKGGIGAPIVGDLLYGTRAERLMLHASWLSFAEPGSARRVEFVSPPPF
jgi:tRNA pseudouridine32 synthase/23S rRNA pseudouridine746 synthase